MNTELQLKMSDRTFRTPEAWFVPGNQVQRWMSELVRCGLAEVTTLLYLIPSSLKDPTPAGVLVVPGAGTRLRSLPSGFACAWIGKRLCIPADADVCPPISPAEADALCGESLVFLHPTLGASELPSEQSLRPWQLLSCPAAKVSEWNQAQLGHRLHPDLTQISLLTPPRMQDVFGAAVNAIGTRPPSELPSTLADETGESRSFAEQLKDLVARGIEGMAAQLPEQSEGKDWVNPLTEWARRHLQQENQTIQKERAQELQRLLNQLKEDPESGLRYAIPLADLPHRGRGKPGSRLASRNPDFNSKKLGGEPADFWQTPANLQAKLRKAYAELVNRELALRNFRRAAYIFAHLLGDLPSAANALKQGKHYREAALLYEEQMQNPAEAARCLEEGDLLQEALERYQKLGTKPDIARIHEKRGDQASAKEIWRQVVAEHRANQDFLEAARLLEEKLGTVEEAAQELLAAWPDSPQAIPCLHALLELWSKLGAHQNTTDFLHQIARTKGSFWKQDGFLEILIQQARRHPDPRVRKETANLCLIAISRRLQESRLPLRTVSRLASHLAELAPNDRLLCRDANRYLNKRRQTLGNTPKSLPSLEGANVDAPASKGRRNGGYPLLPTGIRWLSFKPISSGFYGLGVQGMDFVLVRASWTGTVQSQRLIGPPTRNLSELLFEPVPPDGQEVILRLSADHRFAPIRFPVASPCFPLAARASSPTWLGSLANQVCCTSRGVWTIEISRQSAVICHYQLDGTLRRTWEVGDHLAADGELTTANGVCIAASAKTAAVSLGNRLLILDQRGAWEGRELRSPIRQLLVDEYQDHTTVVASHAEGVTYCTPPPSMVCEALAETSRTPLMAKLGRGLIFIHEGEEGRVVQLTSDGGTERMHVVTGGREIIAAMPSEPRGTFALVDQEGGITRHQLPPSRS